MKTVSNSIQVEKNVQNSSFLSGSNSSSANSSNGINIVGDYKQSAQTSNHGGPNNTWWLICNGQAVSRSTFNSLFTIIGTTFGSGNGSTTFNVPNFQNVINGNITNVITIGTQLGSNMVTLSTSNLPSHSHTITDPGHSHTYTFPQATLAGPSGTYDNYITPVPVSTSTNLTGITGTNNTGSGTSFSVQNNTLYGGSTFIYSGN